MDTEIWKDIRGYEGLYQVSSLGRIRNRDGKVLKPDIGKNGYEHLSLCKKGVVRDYRVHRLVALAFIDNPDGLPIINHKDENKQNNSVENLEWCTHSYNTTYGSCPSKRSKAMRQRLANRDKNANDVPVICLDTGKRYLCILDAAEDTNTDPSTIVKVCKHKKKRKTAGGFRWEYADALEGNNDNG